MPAAPNGQAKLLTAAVVEAIEVRGNRAISSAAIAARIQTKPGDKFEAAAVERDAGSLRSLGFTDVFVTSEDVLSGGKVIIFSVREKLAANAR